MKKRTFILLLFLSFAMAAFSQTVRYEGKYRLKTKPVCRFTTNTYEEYSLELTVDSLYILKCYNYSSAMKNSGKTYFDLKDYKKDVGRWSVKKDTINLAGLTDGNIVIIIKDKALFLDGDLMTKKKGYFVMRRKKYKPLF